jgi:hypothetical protein
MRRLRCGAALLAMAVSCAAPAGAQQPQASASAGPAQLQWLTGCWAGAAGAETVEENWMPLRAGTLVGAGRATRNDRTTSVELMVIRMRGDTLAFHAFPVGQGPAVFPAESVSDSAVVFANPAHDFPQRISYRRVGGDSLVARIEGPGDDGPRGFDYHLRRVACPTP